MAAELKLQTIGQPSLAQPSTEPVWRRNRFMDRLRWQESGEYISDEERSQAVGDTGKAVGPYQIWPIYVDQANNLLREKKDTRRFTLADRTDRAKSEEIIDVMMPWMIEKFKTKFGRNPTETEMARLHHSGGLGRHFGSSDDLKYGVKFDEKAALIKAWEGNHQGFRKDETRKGYGFWGPQALKDKNGKIIPNAYATEISVGVNFDGKEVEIPTLVPTLTQAERKYLTTEGNDPRNNPVIMKKAIDHAKKRMARGLSPFRDTPPGSPPKASAQRGSLVNPNGKSK